VVGGGNTFWYVYRVVVGGEKLSMSGSVFWECVRVAAENKVLLHFLRVLSVKGGMRFREKAMFGSVKPLT